MLERNPGPLGKLAHTLSLVSLSLSLFFSKVRVRSSGQARPGQVRSGQVPSARATLLVLTQAMSGSSRDWQLILYQ